MSYVIFCHSLRDRVLVFFREVYHFLIDEYLQILGRVFEWKWVDLRFRGSLSWNSRVVLEKRFWIGNNLNNVVNYWLFISEFLGYCSPDVGDNSNWVNNFLCLLFITLFRRSSIISDHLISHVYLTLCDILSLIKHNFNWHQSRLPCSNWVFQVWLTFSV